MILTKYRAAIVLTLIGVVFLVPQVQRTINGAPLSLTPGYAAAISFFLSAVASLVVRRKSAGSSGPPSA